MIIEITVPVKIKLELDVETALKNIRPNVFPAVGSEIDCTPPKEPHFENGRLTIGNHEMIEDGVWRKKLDEPVLIDPNCPAWQAKVKAVESLLDVPGKAPASQHNENDPDCALQDVCENVEPCRPIDGYHTEEEAKVIRLKNPDYDRSWRLCPSCKKKKPGKWTDVCVMCTNSRMSNTSSEPPKPEAVPAPAVSRPIPQLTDVLANLINEIREKYAGGEFKTGDVMVILDCDLAEARAQLGRLERFNVVQAVDRSYTHLGTWRMSI